MDLNEHALSEAQRTLKRLGITHVLRTGSNDQTRTAPPLSLEQATPRAQSSAQDIPRPQKAADTESPLPLLLRSLFHGKQIPSRTLWTYAGLYRDLQETDNPPRLEVFKRIQDSVCLHLKWSTATLCSWPLDIDPQLFKKGIERFQPQTVILFGGHENGHDRDLKENLAILEKAGPLIAILPNLEEMAQGNQQLKNEAWRILQTLQG